MGRLVSKIFAERMTAEIGGDFVVFLIGARINKPWLIHKWLPVLLAMSRMLRELASKPDLGLLGYTMTRKVIVQYWRSFDQLEAYAHNRDAAHLPAWAAFNRRVAKSRGDVGIWHEAYLIQAGEYETVYRGMPAFGLGAVGTLLPATGRREHARGRLRADG